MQAPDIVTVVNEAFQRNAYYWQEGIERIQLDDLHIQIKDEENYRVFVCLSKPGNPKVLGAGFLHVKGTRGPTGPRGNVFMLATATG